MQNESGKSESYLGSAAAPPAAKVTITRNSRGYGWEVTVYTRPEESDDELLERARQLEAALYLHYGTEE